MVKPALEEAASRPAWYNAGLCSPGKEAVTGLLVILWVNLWNLYWVEFLLSVSSKNQTEEKKMREKNIICSPTASSLTAS